MSRLINGKEKFAEYYFQKILRLKGQKSKNSFCYRPTIDLKLSSNVGL